MCVGSTVRPTTKTSLLPIALLSLLACGSSPPSGRLVQPPGSSPVAALATLLERSVANVERLDSELAAAKRDCVAIRGAVTGYDDRRRDVEHSFYSPDALAQNRLEYAFDAETRAAVNSKSYEARYTAAMQATLSTLRATGPCDGEPAWAELLRMGNFELGTDEAPSSGEALLVNTVGDDALLAVIDFNISLKSKIVEKDCVGTAQALEQFRRSNELLVSRVRNIRQRFTSLQREVVRDAGPADALVWFGLTQSCKETPRLGDVIRSLI